MTTINDLLAALLAVPEDKRDLPIYVCDDEHADNSPVTSVSLYDQGEGCGEDNPLSIHFANNNSTPLTARIQSEEQAMGAISDLRARFDMVGTEFVKTDIEDQVEAVIGEVPKDVADFLAPFYVEEIISGHYWTALKDILAERGNEHLSDAAMDVCGLAGSTPFGADKGIRVTAQDEYGKSLRETTLRDRIDSLVCEVEQAKQVPGVVSVTIHEVYEDWTPAKENRLTVWSL